jgi:hypothetical protein
MAAPATTPHQSEVTLVAQVTAAVLAALQASGTSGGVGVDESASLQSNDAKTYTTFQLAKLKGFCGVLDNCDIPPIWDYFRTTKEVDAHRTKLLECMCQWAREHEISITRGLYFDKSTMDEITKLDFNPGSATAHFTTAEKGMFILIIRPQTGHETADLRAWEQAMKLTEKNYTLTDALGL